MARQWAEGRHYFPVVPGTYGLGFPVLSVDEVGKKRQAWIDGLARTIEVDEPDSTGTLTLSTCYEYDLLNNVTEVDQGTQTRTYTYDGLSRQTAATTPESGTTNFYFTNSTGGLCSGNPNVLCRRAEARSITVTYAYDAENRVTSKTTRTQRRRPASTMMRPLSRWAGPPTPLRTPKDG